KVAGSNPAPAIDQNKQWFDCLFFIFFILFLRICPKSVKLELD
ncbi:hypothetical protein HMPREF3213_01190, partial [Heyndrickxia coagulans]